MRLFRLVVHLLNTMVSLCLLRRIREELSGFILMEAPLKLVEPLEFMKY